MRVETLQAKKNEKNIHRNCRHLNKLPKAKRDVYKDTVYSGVEIFEYLD
jgi:hypothetical protein